MVIYVGLNLGWNLPQALQIRLDHERWSKLQGATWSHSDIPAYLMFYFQFITYALMTTLGISIIYLFLSRSRKFPIAIIAFLAVRVLLDIFYLTERLGMPYSGGGDYINNAINLIGIFMGSISIFYLISSRRVNNIFIR
ncbi:hypothetical protein ABIC51_006877 [Burkholderia sp. 572]